MPPPLPADITPLPLLQRWIWTLLAEYRFLTQGQMTQLTGASQSYLSRVLTEMDGAGLARKDGGGGHSLSAPWPPACELPLAFLPERVLPFAPMARWLWSLTQRFPGATLRELGAATASPPPRLREHLKNLCDAGLLRAEGQGYQATPPALPLALPLSQNLERDKARFAQRQYRHLKHAEARARERYMQQAEINHIYHVYRASPPLSLYVVAPTPPLFAGGEARIAKVRHMHPDGALEEHLLFPTYRLARIQAARHFQRSGHLYAIYQQRHSQGLFALFPVVQAVDQDQWERVASPDAGGVQRRLRGHIE